VPTSVQTAITYKDAVPHFLNGHSRNWGDHYSMLQRLEYTVLTRELKTRRNAIRLLGLEIIPCSVEALISYVYHRGHVDVSCIIVVVIPSRTL
jgi:hypothetical protein